MGLRKWKLATAPTTFIVSSLDFAEQLLDWNGDLNVPLFSSCMTDETSSTYGVRIPIPVTDTNTVPEPKETVELMQEWTRKKSQIVFRGSISSIDRLRLLSKASGLHGTVGRFLNFSLTGVPDGAPCENDRKTWCPAAPSEWLKKSQSYLGGVSDQMSLRDQVNQFKYILSVDGVGCAYRLRNLLCSSSVVVKQESPYKEFWYDDIGHEVEIMTTARNFEGLESTVSLLSNTSAKQHISRISNSNAYCKSRLSEEAVSLYLVTLIKAYGLQTSCET